MMHRWSKRSARSAYLLAFACAFFGGRRAEAANPACKAVVSGFWDRLDALCAESRTRQPQGSTDGGVPDATLDPEVRVYCETQVPPPFAALSEGARVQRLLDIARRMNVDVQKLPAAQHGIEVRAALTLIDLVGADNAGHALDTPAGALLIGQFTGAACSSPEARRWLPATCTPSKRPSDYRSLVRALVADIADLPARIVEASSKQDPSAVTAIQILLRALIEAPDPYTFARALVESDGAHAEARGCTVGDAALSGVVPSDGGTAGRLIVAGQILRRLLEDGSDTNRADDHYVRAIAQVLRDGGRLAATASLSALQQVNAVALIKDARDLRVARTALETATPDTWRSVALRLTMIMVSALQHALIVADDRDEQIPAGTLMIARALIDGDLPAALTAALAFSGERPPIGADVLKAVGVGARFAVARSEEDAKRVLRELILPSWLGGLIVDASVGIPIVGLDQVSLDFVGTLGWESDRWGAWARASRNLYDTDLNDRDWTEVRTSVSAAGWLNFANLDAKAGWFLGADLSLDQLSSDLTIFRTGTVSDEVSQIVRGNLTLGFWANLSNNAVVRLRGEGGFHEEYYSQDVAAGLADGGSSSRDDQSTAGDYRGQALLSWRVAPGFARVALQGRAAYFQLTRSSTLFTYNQLQPFNQQNTTTSTSRLGAGLRTGIEVEALEIGHLVRPGAFIDIAYTNTDNGKSSLSQTVVTTGVGLRSYLPD